ncbi:MAG TPA: response regulator [Terriglobales bacterium]|nr:response regulator [Terriglobales bacterium]
MGRVLVIDAELQVYKTLAEGLVQGQHTSVHAAGVEQARQAIGNDSFDVVLADERLPDGNAAQMLAAIREADPQVSIVLLTTPATLEVALANLRAGAFDLLTKPLSPEVARATVERASEHTSLLRENHRLKAEVERLKASPAIARTGHGAGNGTQDVLDISWIETLPPSFDLRGLLATLEKSMIERTLHSTRGAQAEAARRLGLSRSDLSYKLLKYELRKETTAAS